MAAKILSLATLFFTLTGCHANQGSLPVIHAAVSTPRTTVLLQANSPAPLVKDLHVQSITTDDIDRQVPKQLCYPFIHRRPRSQRADAVQARLQQADRMTAAFDPLLTVDLIGDHANVLSLEFPADLPAEALYAYRVSAVVEDYLSSPDITDYLCNAGFAEVRLAVKGMNDGLLHPMWKADVTSEGLIKAGTMIMVAEAQHVSDRDGR